MKRILLIVLTLLALCSVASATRLTGLSVENINTLLFYDYNAPNEKVFDNTIKVSTRSFVADFDKQYRTPNGNENFFWLKKGISETIYVIGIKGIIVSVENLSDEPVAIKWGQSSLSMGNYSGVPFLGGMKYKDAGVPSATPDTLIPPHFVATQVLYLGSPTFKNGWKDNLAIVKTDGSLNAIVTMKVETNNGNKYYSFQTPNIYLPDYVIKNHSKN